MDDGKSRSSISNDGITYLSIYKNPVRYVTRPIISREELTNDHSQDDWEPSQQYAVSNVTSCEVQRVSHRKQGPILPTLIIAITPDPATEKLRKRRSSRAATLVSNKDNGPTTLWFRTEGDVSKLHEWARSIQVASQPNFPDHLLMSPMSPISPMSGPLTPGSPSFQNPFVPYAATRDGTDFFSQNSSRPPSAPSAPGRVSLHHKASSSLHTHRERPLTISDAPSLRSRRSDLSSLPGSVANINISTAHQQHSYTSVLPHDLPTPSEGSDGELFGWTSAQGRASNMLAQQQHSPARTVRDSLGSNPPLLSPLSPAAMMLDNNNGGVGVGSPPGPRETILDRAFQLKYIPGCADQTAPGEEKLSSMARFEALMQQVESNNNKRTTTAATGAGAEGQQQQRKRSLRPMSVLDQLELKSAWELDESDEDSDDSDDTEGESAADRESEADNNSIRPESRRTATFPTSQQQQQQQQQARQQQKPSAPQTPTQSPRGTAGIRSPIALNPEALTALVSSSSGESPDRPRLAHRMHSAMGSLSLGVINPPHHGTSHSTTTSITNNNILNSLESSPGKNSTNSNTSSSGETSSTYDGSTPGLNPSAAYRTSTILEGQQLHRLSAASSNGGKRLSFTDFTRRLSSTGSMLLATASSSQAGTPTGNGETADGQIGHSQSRRSSVFQPRAPPAAMGAGAAAAGQGAPAQTDRNEKCKSWRNSVGMFGNEGGFL